MNTTPASEPETRPTAARAHEPPPGPDRIRDALRQVIDPEVGLDVVSLGLIYPGVGAVEMELVWEPRWHAGMIREDR